MAKKHPVVEIEPLDDSALAAISPEMRTWIDQQLGRQPAVAPGSGIGDLLRYLPIVLAWLQGLLAGGSEIPAIKTRIFGRRVTIGPTPLKWE
jgi:hypothetical protein